MYQAGDMDPAELVDRGVGTGERILTGNSGVRGRFAQPQIVGHVVGMRSSGRMYLDAEAARFFRAFSVFTLNASRDFASPVYAVNVI